MTQGEVEEGTIAHGAEEDGVAAWVWRAGCQWSGSSDGLKQFGEE